MNLSCLPCNPPRWVQGARAGERQATRQTRHSRRAKCSSTSPQEWYLVRDCLRALLRRSCHPAQEGASPIVQGCASFSLCVDFSAQCELRIDIGAIEAVGQAQLNLSNALVIVIIPECSIVCQRLGELPWRSDPLTLVGDTSNCTGVSLHWLMC